MSRSSRPLPHTIRANTATSLNSNSPALAATPQSSPEIAPTDLKRGLTPHIILTMQRTQGNAAVQRLLKRQPTTLASAPSSVIQRVTGPAIARLKKYIKGQLAGLNLPDDDPAVNAFYDAHVNAQLSDHEATKAIQAAFRKLFDAKEESNKKKATGLLDPLIGQLSNDYASLQKDVENALQKTDASQIKPVLENLRAGARVSNEVYRAVALDGFSAKSIDIIRAHRAAPTLPHQDLMACLAWANYDIVKFNLIRPQALINMTILRWAVIQNAFQVDQSLIQKIQQVNASGNPAKYMDAKDALVPDNAMQAIMQKQYSLQDALDLINASPSIEKKHIAPNDLAAQQKTKDRFAMGDGAEFSTVVVGKNVLAAILKDAMTMFAGKLHMISAIGRDFPEFTYPIPGGVEVYYAHQSQPNNVDKTRANQLALAFVKQVGGPNNLKLTHCVPIKTG